MNNKGAVFSTGFKTILSFLVMGYFIYLFVNFTYFPESPKSTSIKERQEATFLNLNESVVLELNDKEKYEKIKNIETNELGKDRLFEKVNKNDYSF